MRIELETKDEFRGTHEGCGIFISRGWSPPFYFDVFVYDLKRGALINITDNVAPPEVKTMAQAKRFAKEICTRVHHPKMTRDMRRNWLKRKYSMDIEPWDTRFD